MVTNMQQSKGETEAFSTSFSSKYVSGIQVGHRKILIKKEKGCREPNGLYENM